MVANGVDQSNFKTLRGTCIQAHYDLLVLAGTSAASSPL